MPDVPKPGGLDLSGFSEGMRRRLYDRIVEVLFGPPEVRHTPDEAGLQVVFFAGRWFATWLDLSEPPPRSIALRFRIVRVGFRPDLTAGIELYEV